MKSRAESARSAADDQLRSAEEVTQALSEASEAQGEAEAAVQAAQDDIDAARVDLVSGWGRGSGEDEKGRLFDLVSLFRSQAMIEAEMDEAVETSDRSVLGVSELAQKSQPLQNGKF